MSLQNSDTLMKIDRIEAPEQVLLENQFQNLIDDLMGFTTRSLSFAGKTAIYDHYWNGNSPLVHQSAKKIAKRGYQHVN